MKKMQITIGKGIKISGIDHKVKMKIIRDLSFVNPKYTEAIKNGRMYGHLNKHLRYYTESGNQYWLPKGYMPFLTRFCKENQIPFKINDKSLLKEYLDFEFQAELRDYQKKAVKSIKRYPLGVLEASTGAGKTVIGIYMIAERGQPTLIIVHSKELLYQWRDSIKKFLDYDCGLIGNGKKEIKPITVGIINSVSSNLKELTPKFGHLIIDECHRVVSDRWYETVKNFPSKYFLGLSATTYRADKLDKVIFYSIGKKIHTVDKDMLHEIGAVLKPEIKFVNSNFYFRFADSFAKMMTALCENEERNNLIINTIKGDLRRFNDNVIVVSDRTKHCLKLQLMLSENGIKSEVLTGKVGNKKRTQIVQDMKAGKVKVIISTSSLIGEGFDMPNLTALILGTPLKWRGRLTQVVGRILRPLKGKKPRIYDIQDSQVGVFSNQARERKRTYRDLWGI
jgi:superfamily II DNA or RNA helicase